MHWVGKNVAIQQIRGLWFECQFEAVPVDLRFKAYDHALERVVTRAELPRHQDSYFLCTLKRQLSKRELRRFGLRNARVTHSNGAQSSACSACMLKTALRFQRAQVGRASRVTLVRLQFRRRVCNDDSTATLNDKRRSAQNGEVGGGNPHAAPFRPRSPTQRRRT